MGQVSDFLEDIRTRLEALTDGGSNVFARVWIAPFLDIDKLMEIPRWPTAVIFDNGGSLDPYNGKIWTRAFSVAIVDCHPRDHVGEKTVKAILDRGELLMNDLEYDTDDSIFNAGDNDLEATSVDNDLMMLIKTYQFTAEFERS